MMDNLKEFLTGVVYIGFLGFAGYVTIKLITKAVGVGS